jgi:hypothetical protein
MEVIMKKVVKIILGISATIGIIVFGYVMLFIDGKMTAKYNSTVGIEVKDSQRNMYQHSATYVEAKVQELSKEKLELAKTGDIASRKAIIETLVSDCANLDIEDINDKSIKQFLTGIRNGSIQ